MTCIETTLYGNTTCNNLHPEFQLYLNTEGAVSMQKNALSAHTCKRVVKGKTVEVVQDLQVNSLKVDIIINYQKVSCFFKDFYDTFVIVCYDISL